MYRSTSGEGVVTAAATATEMAALTGLCLPMLVTNLCQAVLPITSFAYAGQLANEATLAGLGLGVSVCNITGV